MVQFSAVNKTLQTRRQTHEESKLADTKHNDGEIGISLPHSCILGPWQSVSDLGSDCRGANCNSQFMKRQFHFKFQVRNDKHVSARSHEILSSFLCIQIRPQLNAFRKWDFYRKLLFILRTFWALYCRLDAYNLQYEYMLNVLKFAIHLTRELCLHLHW